MQSTNHHRQRQKLLAGSFTNLTANSKLVLTSIMLSFLLIGAIITFSIINTIEDSITAPGIVVPVGKNKIMRHLEGGVVEQVFISNGNQVAAGQRLITLNPAASSSELDSTNNRILTLQLELIRLQAYADEQLLSYDDVIKALTAENISTKTINKHRDLIDNSVLLLQNQHKSRKDERALLAQNVDHLKQRLETVEKQLTNKKKNLRILAAEKKMYKALDASQAISKISLINANKHYNATEAKLLEITAEKQQLTRKTAEASQQLIALNSEIQESTLQEISLLNAKLIAANDSLHKAEERLERLTIVASEDGIVQNFNLATGSVILPGEKILEIAPTNNKMIIEAKISTKEVAQIKIGSKVTVSVPDFESTSYASLPGTISSISSSTMVDALGTPYYAATIDLNQEYLAATNTNNSLIPGMIVSTKVITAKKSLLKYLLG